MPLVGRAEDRDGATEFSTLGFLTDIRDGLTESEASFRRDAFGTNELPPPVREALVMRVVRHSAEPMTVLLLIAAAVSGLALREAVDGVAILAIVLANVGIALIQEGRAVRALDALRAMETPVATVIRENRNVVIASRDVVPGDLVLIAAGDRIPADLRLTETVETEIDESMLTGESLPVAKDAGATVASTLPPAEQAAMAFAGTLAVRGTARGVAVSTGPRTQLGRIAQALDGRQQPTPLQRDLRSLTLRLGIVAAGVAAAVFAVSLLRFGAAGGGLEIAFLSAVALAVAAVPEGLPSVVTVALALGVRRMAGHGSIVRRLPAVETLGATTVILTDKTGTLTENRMRVDCVVGPDGEIIAQSNWVRFRPAAEVLALCNDATLDPPTGDPMEVAMLEAVGSDRVSEIRAIHPRVSSVPFDAQRKCMATVNVFDGRRRLLVKGAPETVIPLCTSALDDEAPLDDAARQSLLETADHLAGRGARVLALAVRMGAHAEAEASEGRLSLTGLVALRDGIRAEAPGAIAEARRAGLHIIMVTGDHPGTALAVAREVGLASNGAAITGSQLRTSGLPLDPIAVPVYARVDPGEKLALTEALQGRGHVVAVTGDGVNDAPALRRADIGVAMGRSGSDVAREAADMVITDDNLATIVTAVREGRGIYDNIRKVVEYLIAGNLSEILVVVCGLIFFPGLGAPLLPLQLLWINLLTDGFPALGLGVDPVDPALMDRPPRPRRERLLSGRRLGFLGLRGCLIAGASLAALSIARFAWNEPWTHARSSLFSVLMTAHLLYAFAVRSRPRGGARNGWLLAAVLGGLALQALIVAVPVFHSVFGTTHFSLREWVLVALLGPAPALLIRGLGRYGALGFARDGAASPRNGAGRH